MSPPRVVLDGREFQPGRQTGIGRYLGILLGHVRRHPPAWALETVAPPGSLAPEGAPLREVGRADAWTWDWLVLPAYLRRADARAYVTPYVKFRPSSRYAVIAVVCDPTDLLPGLERGGARRWLARLARTVLARRAVALVTISSWSRGELARILRLPAERFRVVPPAVTLTPPAGDGAGRAILHLGNGKPHKNVPGLVAAYAALPPSLQAEHPLVIAGLHAEQRPAIERAVAHVAPRGAVRLLGHVPDAELPALYATAAVFAFPSRAEGFGIPPLEAMACGIPVVASTAGALPETLGDAAVLVAPDDRRALRDALAAALTDPALRARLVGRGRARAAEFGPERTGTALVETVDAAVGAVGAGVGR